MLKRMLNSFLSLFKGFVSWLDRSLREAFKSPDEAIEQAPAQLDDGEAQPRSKSVPRIPPHERGIYVQCASCNLLHKIEAVCLVCGEPLCSDTRHCRKIRYNNQLGKNAIYCPTHAPAPSGPSY